MTVAHIGHVELSVTDLEASTGFFEEIVGLTVSRRDPDRAFLRPWQDWDHHTLVLTRSDRSAVEHVGWRVERPEHLPRFQRRLDDLGIEHRWMRADGEPGQGDGLRFQTPAGLPLELYWEVQPYAAPAAVASRLPSHPQRTPRTARHPPCRDTLSRTEPKSVPRWGPTHSGASG